MTSQDALHQAFTMEHMAMRPIIGDAKTVLEILAACDVHELRHWSRLIAEAANRIDPPNPVSTFPR